MIRVRIEIEVDGAEEATPAALEESLIRHLEGETILIPRRRGNHHVVIDTVSEVHIVSEA